MKRKTLLVFFLLIATSFACEVPVFRYALERWERDLYKVFIIHRGDLSENDTALWKQIQDNAIGYGGHTNILAYKVNVADEKEAGNFHKIYAKLKDIDVNEKPQILLLFPNITKVYDPIWQGDLNQKNIDELLKPKATSKLMTGILQGYSSTFLLMESGNKEKDERAAETIKKAMAELKESLDIPEGIVQTDGEVTGGKLSAYQAATIDPSNVLKSGIPLKIDFNMVRMPNNDSHPIFRSILGKVFTSKKTEGEPRLFAFFGRGRLLGPMVGEEITVKHISQLSAYLCSACSCQVKRQNPGLDFLTTLNWTSYLQGSEVVVDKELPPLIGLLDISPEDVIQDKEENEEPITKAVEGIESSSVFRNTAFTILGAFICILGGTFMMRRK